MANMTVFACVRLLADTIAALPWKAYRRDSNGTPKELPNQPVLLQQPYPTFDLFQWKWMVVASMALRGNSFHYVTARDRNGYPTALLPLHPDILQMEMRNDITMWFDPIYRVLGERVDSTDIVHIRRFTMPGEPYGLSPIRQAAIAIGMGLSAEEYGYRYFKESANPSGVLSTDQDLDEPTVRRQQKNWIASHGGRRMPAVLTNGFKWETLSISPEESQFLETRQFQRSEICMMYGVPPILIGDTKETTAWGTGVEQITLGAVTYTFSAWTACIESEISSLLPRGQFVRFDYDALLRGDTEGRYNAYKTAIQGTWMTPNEVRAREEMDPVEGGDILLQPTNLSEFPYDAAAKVPTPTGEKPVNGESPSDSIADKLKEIGRIPGKTISGGEKTPPRNGKPVGITAK
jgi:HK97 family phage portal protein